MSLISRRAIDGLVASGAIAPVPGSLVMGAGPGDAKAAAAVKADAGSFDAVKVLAAPTRVLEVTELKRGAAPFMRRVYLRGERACAAGTVADGVRVEATMSVTDLCKQLAAKLAGPDGAATALLPSEVALVAHLWPEQKRSLANALSVEACVEGLTRAGIAAEAAREAIAALQQTKLLRPSARGLAVPRAQASVLESFWSGELLELKAGAFDGSQSTTLLFVGPEKQRYLVERLQTAVWQRTGGSDEEPMVFQGLTRAAVQRVVAAALGLVARK